MSVIENCFGINGGGGGGGNFGGDMESTWMGVFKAGPIDGGKVGLISFGSGKLNENCGKSDSPDSIISIWLKWVSTVLEDGVVNWVLEEIFDSCFARIWASVVIIAITSSLVGMVVGWTGGKSSEVLLDEGIIGILNCTGGLLVVVAAEAPPWNTRTILN